MGIAESFIGFFILAVLVIVGCFVLFKMGGGRAIAIAMGLLFGMGLLVFLFTALSFKSGHSVPVSSSTSEFGHTNEYHSAVVPPVAEVQALDFQPGLPELEFPNATGSSNWDENIEETCDTDVYTQGQFAAASLARKIAGRIQEKTNSDTIVVVTDETRGSHSHRLQNYHSMTLDNIARELADDRFSVVASKPKDISEKTAIVTVALELDQINGEFASLARKSSHSHGDLRDPRSAECKAKVTCDGIEWNCSALFVDNLWVSDFGAFQTSEEGDRYTVVRTASDLHTSSSDAANDLESRINAVLFRKFEHYFEKRWPDKSLPSDRQFQSAMMRIKQHGNGHILPVVDRFSQSMTVNGQEFSRAAALIKDSRVRHVADELNQGRMYVSVGTDRGMTFARLLSIFGIFGIVVIGYYFADAATRGYYSPVLAGLCVVIFITISVVLA